MGIALLSERADAASGPEVRELLHDIGAVGLELGSFVESSLELRAEGILSVHHEVSDPGSHDELGDRDLVASGPLLVVVVQVLLHHLVVELSNRDEGRNVCLLLVLRSEEDGRALGKDIGECVNDRVGIAGHLPVLSVVVAELDAEHAEDGAHLRETVLLSVDSDECVRKSTSKLTAISSSLLGLPGLGFPRFLVVLLAVVLKDLLKRVAAAVEAEVSPLNLLLEDSFALGSFASGAWLSAFGT